MALLKVVFLFLVAAETIYGQSFRFSTCPKIKPQENFNVTQYLGTWYEIKKLPAMFERGKCVQAKYSLLQDGAVRVHNSELLKDGKINSIEGTAKVEDHAKPAILSVSFFKVVPDSPYIVLNTDYSSYALVYSCSDYFGLFHIDFAWILSRTRHLDSATVSLLQDKLTLIGVDVSRLSVTDQTGCGPMASA
ncbi:apolipoprotein Db [Boleophthalmus pectinirostris]|uniref:apolipoprotein Db n=1 Tax=Boleophthalmus pectinirostris TaxID=150288 RepID=UPI00242CC54E|nr:apolipoprotein Db [Boleophthalmus pectinirostris]